MTRSDLHSKAPFTSRRAWPILMLLAVAGTGCFRTTGMPRPTLVATEVPLEGGERVAGLKATAGPGDFYLGNDFIGLTVDGAPWQERTAQFGAPSGGAILDIGTINLDQNFHRVATPTDLVDRLTPVLNQDPDLPLVFDRMTPVSDNESSRIEMVGGVLDPLGKLGMPTDANHRVVGLSVAHTLSLQLRGRHFDVSTTVTNTTAAPVAVYSVGDFLEQRQGAGFRFVVPAQETSGMTQAGGFAPVNLVHNWGVEIPGSDFSKPLESAVRAVGVGLQSPESAGDMVDSHLSLGIASSDPKLPQVLVTADAQSVLSEARPRFSRRLVVGRLPNFAGGVPSVLAANDSITFNRRLYLSGGPSNSILRTSQASDAFNQIYVDRSTIMNESYGLVGFNTFGTAQRSGALQTEIRFERYLTPAVFDPVADLLDNSKWKTERVEFLERGEAYEGFSNLTVPNAIALPTIADTTGDPTRTSHNQVFRVVVKNRNEGANTPFLKFTNRDESRVTSLPDFLEPRYGKPFSIREALAPERNNFPFAYDEAGNLVNFRLWARYFASRNLGGDPTVLQPMRIVIAGLGPGGALDATQDPNLMRRKHWSSIFYPNTAQRVGGDTFVGSVSFRAGNEAFGTGFPGSGANYFQAIPFELPPAKTFRALAIRGPLSALVTEDFSTRQDLDPNYSTLLMGPSAPPAGWMAFDVPGPSLATSGGMHPMEQLTSALSEGVGLVGRTEVDRNVSGSSQYAGFRAELEEFGIFDSQRAVIGAEPFVIGGRTSRLPEGAVTGLFTPDPAVAGAHAVRPSTGWTLADFLTQSESQFTVVHRPLGPGGLLQVKGYSLSDPLGSGANAWWTQTGPLSATKRNGDFDAFELLRGESLTSQTPTQWHQEYRTLRAFWFKVISAQAPTAFTKALGLSSGTYSLDTPVGLARTYLKVPTTLAATDLTPVLTALKSGAAVASTGPLLEVDVNGTTGPGQLLTGTHPTVTLNITVTAPAWVPVETVRVYVNGVLVQTLDPATFTVDTADPRRRTRAIAGLALSQDSWIVVEAGTPDAGPTLGSAPWNALYPVWFKLQRNIYPLAITNPIFVDQNGGGYTPPGS
jgi:hypothetical protein